LASLAVGAGLSSRLLLLLFTDRPRLADEWPWLVGTIVVVMTFGVVIRRRVANHRSSRTVAPADEELPADGQGMEVARRLARSGQRIQATKAVRQVTGLPLDEALAVVERMEKESGSE
jgi:hypothetical protein